MMLASLGRVWEVVEEREEGGKAGRRAGVGADGALKC
jgi:hypothetical protein